MSRLGFIAVSILLPVSAGCAKNPAPPCAYPVDAYSAALPVSTMIIADEPLPQHHASPFERTSCADAEKLLQDQLVRRAAYRGYPYFYDAVPMPEGTANCEVNILAAPPTLANRDSRTNNQVSGVEEGDIVQSDEHALYILRDSSIEIVGAESAVSARKLGSFSFGGRPLKLLLSNSSRRLLLFTSEVEERNLYTRVRSIDVSSPSRPLLSSERRYAGVLSDVRLVENDLSFVLSESVRLPSGLQELPPYGSEDRGEVMTFNEKLIRAAKVLGENECPPEGLPGDPGFGGLTRIVASDPELKRSSESLLLGRTDARFFSRFTAHLSQNAGGRTELYSYRVKGGEPTLEAVGEFGGTLLNQFSMDEWKGDLRLGVEEFGFQGERASRVIVLRERDGKWQEIGTSAMLGPRESLKAVRFEGDRGYVVTFLQVDPLYTLDLRDPANPVLAGELKVLGYSSYIHPLAGDRLLAVGRDGAALQVSSFDVSTPESPRVLTMETFPAEYSHAEQEHLAFQLSADGKYLALPVTVSCSPRSGCDQGGVRIFELHDAGGLTPINLYRMTGGELAQRIIFLNGSVYLVSSGSLHVLDGPRAQTPFSVIPLPPAATVR